MDINCPHFGKCSGCQRDVNVDKLSLYVQAADFFSTYGIKDFSLEPGSPVQWRCRAKLAVRGSASAPLIGLFEEGTHRVQDIPLCRVHHPSINKGVEVVRSWIVKNNIKPYSDSTENGILRYLQFAVERSTGRLQVVLVLNIREDTWGVRKSSLNCLDELWDNNTDLFHSLWINFNPGSDNVIFSPRWLLLKGEPWLQETICERTICYHPASFAQANLEMFERLIEKLKEFVPVQSDLLEYYAGVGAIGISVADKCHRVRCVEIVPSAKESFDESLKFVPEDIAEKLSFIKGSAEGSINQLKLGADVVIVDPPRKGLEPIVLDALCALENSRLIYVSCGWDGFKRDCAKLVASGWKIIHAESFLFFPGTEHLELLVVFNR